MRYRISLYSDSYKSMLKRQATAAFFVARSLVFAAKSFSMRSSETPPFLHYFGANKSFRIRTYKKGGGGGTCWERNQDCSRITVDDSPGRMTMRRPIRILLIILLFPPTLAAVGGWLAGPSFLHPIRRALSPDLIRQADVRRELASR